MEKQYDSSRKQRSIGASREDVRALGVAALLSNFGFGTQGNHCLQEPIPTGTYQTPIGTYQIPIEI